MLKKKKPLQIKFRFVNHLKDAYNEQDDYYTSGMVYFLPTVALFWSYGSICFCFSWMHVDFEIWIGRELQDLLGSDSILP
jgi:hypothetical protein